MKNSLLSIIIILLALNLIMLGSRPGAAAPTLLQAAPDATGACCVGGTTCYTVDQAECEGTLGGTYMGDGTTCPDACNPPTAGACCLGTTCYTVEESECTGTLGGTFMGGGTDCADGNSNGIADACEAYACFEDIDGSGTVDVVDLLALLGAWGPCP